MACNQYLAPRRPWRREGGVTKLWTNTRPVGTAAGSERGYSGSPLTADRLQPLLPVRAALG